MTLELGKTRQLVLIITSSAYGAGLNTAAVAIGKLYFGSATDNGELSDSAYVSQLSNTQDFGQITPGNSQKVDCFSVPKCLKTTITDNVLIVGCNRAIAECLHLYQRRHHC